MFEYNKNYQYLSSACLNLTDACNLACKYCFVQQHPHYMTLDIAKKSVDFLVKNLRAKKENGYLSENDKCNITFFGGEPTLMWDSIIVPLVNYTEGKYLNEVVFSITTNGVLLNQERINFLFDHNIYPLLSMDGAKRTQDFNRPAQNGQSSFDAVLKNIPILLEKFPEVTFRATIDQESAQYTFENYLFAISQGFHRIFMTPNGRESWSDENKDKLKLEVEKIYWFIANSFCNEGNPIDFQFVNDSFTQIIQHDLNVINYPEEKDITVSRSPSRCGMGTGFGSIGYDGKIYGCQEQDSKTDKNIFYIGDIFSGIDIEKHTILLETYNQLAQMKCSNESLCISCPLKNICSEWACPSSSWDLFKSFFIDSEILCLWRRYGFNNAIILMRYFVENKNDLFEQYLNETCSFKDYQKEESV